MSLVRLKTDPSARDLRVFSSLWLIFCGGAGMMAWHNGAAAMAWLFWGVGVVGGLTGLLAPHAMRYVYLAAIYATFPFGFVISHVVLAAVYYLVLTPTGLIMRLLRYDPLARRFEPAKKSYWRSRSEARPGPSYFRQH